ncbi:hypothetical protein [Cupriavidus pauculus]|uniref:head-tail joining protein n=1 Tax=Cupriavidus pauculus TaxID=82633 RepID=UPI001EE248C0|nr:hypothetical protein [Cupriavidus pauculus]GJG92839.1 hypothetical protein CBA19C6_00140 [Cupriavidus pauculus]
MIDWDAEVIGPLMGVFGEAIQYTPVGGIALTVTGVFDDAFVKEVLFDDASSGVTEVSAVLGVQISQFASAPAQNDQLVVVRTGARFIVREARLDGHGAAKLRLSRME